MQLIHHSPDTSRPRNAASPALNGHTPGLQPRRHPPKGERGWAGKVDKSEGLSTAGRGVLVLPALPAHACTGCTLPCATLRKCSPQEWGTPILRGAVVCCEWLALVAPFVIQAVLLVLFFVCHVLKADGAVTCFAFPTDSHSVANHIGELCSAILNDLATALSCHVSHL